MVDPAEDRIKSPEEIRAEIDEARRLTASAGIDRGTRQRRKAEHNQRKGRVNPALLRGQAEARDELWTIRTKSAQKRAVQHLAEELSEPGAKVSIAALMEEAIELLLAKHREERNA